MGGNGGNLKGREREKEGQPAAATSAPC